MLRVPADSLFGTSGCILQNAELARNFSVRIEVWTQRKPLSCRSPCAAGRDDSRWNRALISSTRPPAAREGGIRANPESGGCRTHTSASRSKGREVANACKPIPPGNRSKPETPFSRCYTPLRRVKRNPALDRRPLTPHRPLESRSAVIVIASRGQCLDPARQIGAPNRRLRPPNCERLFPLAGASKKICRDL